MRTLDEPNVGELALVDEALLAGGVVVPVPEVVRVELVDVEGTELLVSVPVIPLVMTGPGPSDKPEGSVKVPVPWMIVGRLSIDMPPSPLFGRRSSKVSGFLPHLSLGGEKTIRTSW